MTGWRSDKKFLKQFIEDHGWTLKLSKNPDQTIADSGSKTIFLYVLLDKKKTVCYLVHEIGHMLIYHDENYYNEKFKGLQEARDKSYYGSRKYAIGRLYEEIEAWEIGKEAIGLENLSTKISPKLFERIKNDALKTYVDWVYKVFTSKKQQTEPTRDIKTDNNETN
jgi:hypothetical protein